MAWFTQGKVANPTTGLLLVDTGALTAGTYTGTVMGWADKPCTLTLHRRNSANTGDIATQEMFLTTDGTNFLVFTLTITLATNERVTVTNDNTFTGNVQISIIT